MTERREMAPEKVTIVLNGQPYEVDKGLSVLRAAAQVGIEIPHYCWHPYLSVAGNCRMCIVEIEKMRGLPASCAVPVADGMVVRTESQRVLEARAAVLEFLLVNHPLDCPVCDQVGECFLQIYYMRHDRRPSALRTPKVHFEKRLQVGPRVILDQERCIACTRCVRFCDEVSKTSELTMANRGDHVAVETFPGRPLDNPYSLNTVDICPVGALTSADFRFQARAYFLKPRESICPGCATGCNVWLDVYDSHMVPDRNGRIMRLRPRVNDAVNRAWMCDAGRGTKDACNEGRALTAQLHGVDASRDEVLRSAAAALGGARGAAALGLVSLDATCEEMYFARHFMNEVLDGAAALAAPERTPGPADGILMSADRHANRRGADLLLDVADPAAVARRLAGLRAVIVTDLDLSGPAFPPEVGRAFAEVPVRVVLSSRATATARQATHLIPVRSFAEKDGVWVNRDGRAQRLRGAVQPHPSTMDALQALAAIASALGMEMNDVAVEPAALFACMAAEIPALAGLDHDVIGSGGQPLASPGTVVTRVAAGVREGV